MDNLQQLSKAARRLSPDEIRGRLAEMDKEARILRALLRETLRGWRALSLSRGSTRPEGSSR
jgi:hypothetical protein